MLAKLSALFNNQSFLSYFKNSSWMLAEYALRVFSGLFVTIYVARYLGPSDFGTLSYALVMVAILFSIARFGMDSVVVRELTLSPDQSSSILGTSFSIMMIVSITGYLILSGFLYLFEERLEAIIYTLLISVGVFFQTFFVITYWFQSKLKSKYPSIVKSITIIVSSIIKLYLVYIEAELYWFVVAYMLDFVLLGIFLFIMHRYLGEAPFIGHFQRSMVKPLLRSSFPMAVSAIAFSLYAKIDQIMIQNFLGDHALGLYSAAVKLYEGWTMFPYILIISLLPLLVKTKENDLENYETKFAILVSFIFWSSVLVFAGTFFLGDWLIHITFGQEYIESVTVLIILMLSAVFTLLGTLTARYLNVEKMEGKITKITFIALLVNIALNYYLIPLYGIEGGAYATLISMFIAFYAYDMFDPKLRPLFRIKNRGIFFIFKAQVER